MRKFHAPRAHLVSLSVVPVMAVSAVAFAGADLPRRTTHVSRMDGFAGAVEDSQAKIVSDSDSLHATARTLAQDATVFVSSLDAAVNGIGTSAATYDALRDSVANTRTSLSVSRALLQARFADLRSRILMERNRLNMVEKADHAALLYTQGAKATESLAARTLSSLAKLDAALTDLEPKIDATWDPAWEKARIALELWLSTNRVDGWQAKAAFVKTWLAGLDALDSLLPPLEARVESLKDDVAKGRPYAAREKAKRIAADCEQVKGRLTSVSTFEPVRDDALARLDDACVAARSRADVLWRNPSAVPGFVFQFAKKQAALAKLDCAAGGTKFDCSMAEWLARIPKARVLAMGEADLVTYEDAWAKAARLPTRGAR